MLFLESQPALVVDHILVLFVKRVKQYERKDCQTYARGRVVDYNKEAGRLPPTTATSNTQTCQWTGLSSWKIQVEARVSLGAMIRLVVSKSWLVW